SCCCQVQSLSWVPVRPPIAAVSIATLLPLPLSGLLTHCWCVPFFGHRVLADYGPPKAAARPLICHGPLYRLLILLPGPESLMGPCTALPLLLSPSRHSAMCHFQVSSHCWCVQFF
ncbi:unnamed protein product, partial [Staurois parvus]